MRTFCSLLEGSVQVGGSDDEQTGQFDLSSKNNNQASGDNITMAIYAVVQRLIHELVQDEADACQCTKLLSWTRYRLHGTLCIS